MGNFINNIKQIFNKIFRKEKTYLLPEAETNMKTSNFLSNTYKSTNLSTNKELESGILQYLSSYLELANNYENSHTIPDSYNALLRINGGPKCQSEKNITDEHNLIYNLTNRNDYVLQTNLSKDGSPVFYHVQSSNYSLPNRNDIIRLYLNCSPDNIAELAYNIIENNQEDNFYLKFSSTIENYKYPRSDKIVIYTDKNHFSNTVASLNDLFTQRPDLFKDSDKVNPFANRINSFLTYGFEPQVNQFTKLDGTTQNAGSHNKLVALALEDSYMSAAKEIAKQDENIKFLLDPNYANDPILFVQNFPYLESNYHNYLISSMQSKLQYLCYQNAIEINNINPYKEQNYDQQQNSIDNR